MSTITATSRCVSCGESIYSTRFCESCGAKVPLDKVDNAPTSPPASEAIVKAGDSNAARVQVGLLLAFNGMVWTPIVPLATGWGTTLLVQWFDNYDVYYDVWPIEIIAATIAPLVVTIGLILAARFQDLSRNRRVWAIALAVLAGLANALGAVYSGIAAGFFTATVPSLGALIAIGSWGLIAQFRGPGYWSFLYVFIAGILISLLSMLAYFPVFIPVLVAVWALSAFGVVKLAMAHERRATERRANQAEATADVPLATGRTNGFALASLVLALVGGGVLAIVFGHVAHAQIRQTREGGAGLATAGLVIGYLSIVVSVASTIVVAVLIAAGVWR